MAIADQVRSGIDGVLRPEWSVVNGRVVPESESINLTNGAVKLDATYLYADMADSTGLAQGYRDWAVAKIVRCYLNAATRIIKHYGGAIRSFDGDRVMGIFIGDDKNTAAMRTALALNWAIQDVIQPALEAKWESFTWKMSQGVGIDTGDALLVRGGVYGTNDLVSIGSAPNIAAKLSEIRGYKSLFISKHVFENSNDNVRFAADGQQMWQYMGSKSYGGKSVQYYGSSWYWSP